MVENSHITEVAGVSGKGYLDGPGRFWWVAAGAFLGGPGHRGTLRTGGDIEAQLVWLGCRTSQMPRGSCVPGAGAGGGSPESVTLTTLQVAGREEVAVWEQFSLDAERASLRLPDVCPRAVGRAASLPELGVWGASEHPLGGARRGLECRRLPQGCSGPHPEVLGLPA